MKSMGYKGLQYFVQVYWCNSYKMRARLFFGLTHVNEVEIKLTRTLNLTFGGVKRACCCVICVFVAQCRHEHRKKHPPARRH